MHADVGVSAVFQPALRTRGPLCTSNPCMRARCKRACLVVPPLAAEVLEHAAYLGMSAMLVGPLFAPDVRNPQVRALGRAGMG